jgi:hypothetical protein
MAMLHGAPRTFYTDLNGLICKIDFLPSHMARRMPPTHPCMEEATMTRRTMALLTTFTFAILVAPLTGEAPQAGKVYRIGLLAGSSQGPREKHAYEAFQQGLHELGCTPHSCKSYR